MIIIPTMTKIEIGFAKLIVQPNDFILFGGNILLSFLLK
jgi:hypothetical protein